ncbi:MAG: hypothetical protein QOE61_104 [Micromonosporaceae bacterium]|jgi:hypothetical protein|nr:hypothetical protein [Micromonosporaceae bacterium]
MNPSIGKLVAGVGRPSDGVWYVPGITQCGLGRDIFLPGEYNGGNYTDGTVWRPSNSGLVPTQPDQHAVGRR